MPRESYYQDCGNPIQTALLPPRLPNLAIPLKGLPSLQRGVVVLKTLAFFLAVDVADWLLAADCAPSFKVIRAGLITMSGAIVLWMVTATITRGWMFLLLLPSLLLLPPSMMVGVAPQLQTVFAAIILWAYTWLFAQHWLQLCTTSPLDRNTAKILRDAWNRNLLIAAAVPLLATLVAALVRQERLAIFAVTAFLAVSLLLSSISTGTLPTWGPALSALTSWLTYNIENKQRPGTFRSPAGSWRMRIILSSAACFVVVTTLRDVYAWPPVTTLLLVMCLPMFLTLPVLSEAAGYHRSEVPADRWAHLTTQIRNSTNPIERQSYYMARNCADGSPLIVPRSVFREHAHFLGDSGSGKTALGLAPFIEQTVAFGDSSLVVIDLKADSLELLATMVHAAEQLQRRTNQQLAMKHFSNQDHLSTYGFNPLMQPFWNNFNQYTQTDILCGATGLEYGADYGEGFYSAANAGSLHHTMHKYPDIRTFAELADRCGYVINNAKKQELHPEIRKSGVHVHEVLKRLAAFAPLNVCDTGTFPADVVEHTIDFSDVFRRPQMLYFHLSATLAPGASPALARFITYFLLAASTQTERRVPVYLVIDEFQRMVAKNIEYMLQLARSMGVGIILANQSMEDLRTGKTNLIPAIESNCRYRQWFSVSGNEDQRRLSTSSGETVETLSSHGSSENSQGTTTSVSVREQVMPRLSTNDIALTSDHPRRSIVRISRGDGYAQYGGLPFIVESSFHISKDEYQRRRRMPWPTGLPGTFVPAELDASATVDEPARPRISTEVVGQPPEEPVADEDPFASFLKQQEENDLPTLEKEEEKVVNNPTGSAPLFEIECPLVHLSVPKEIDAWSPRDFDILLTLTRRLRMIELSQARQIWWPRQSTSRNARRRLRQLAAAGLVERRIVNVQRLLKVTRPLGKWELSGPEPNLPRIAEQTRARWRQPAVPSEVYCASPKSSNLFASRPSGLPPQSHRDHDLLLSEVYLHYIERSGRMKSTGGWAKTPLSKAGHRIKDSDAFLVSDEGTPFRVIESAGRYSLQQLMSFHEHCVEHDLSYELY